MTALAQALSRWTGVDINAETLEPMCIFCGISLLLPFPAIGAYGIDLSLALF